MKNKFITLMVMFVCSVSLVLGQGFKAKPGTTITLEQDAYVKVANDGNLILEANVSKTASLIDRNIATHVNFSGINGTGESKVEIYLAEDQWHYLSSPVDDAVSNVFLGIYLKMFFEEDSTWFYIAPIDSVLHPMTGYAAWSSGSTTGNTTRTLNGDLNAGSYSVTLTNHGSATHGSKGFNFTGNPFASAIDWQLGSSAWTRTNIDPTIYMWNPLMGQYGNYNRNTKLGTNGVDSIIPPKQGLFVHVTTNGTGTLGVNNNARLHNDKAFFKGSAKMNNSMEGILLTTSGNGYKDETIIAFNENATWEFDYLFDAFKLKGIIEAPQLYSTAGKIKLSVNTLTEIDEDLTVPVNFENGQQGNYLISASNIESLAAEIEVYLEDLKLNVMHDLKLSGDYQFYASPDDNIERFLLHFHNSAYGIDDNISNNNISVWSYQNKTYINNPGNLKGIVTINNILGQQVLVDCLYDGLNTLIIDQTNTKAYYIVTVKSDKILLTNKILITN
ncbi:MAG: hypothetical protein K8R58_12660 [Bacteroidales bacterium]|nr:hypothetical protein [Bacteroidales bacterium]